MTYFRVAVATTIAFILVATATLVMIVLSTRADAADTATRHPVVAAGDSIAAGVGARDPLTQSWPARIGATNVAVGGSCLYFTGCGWGITLTDSFDDVLALAPSEVLVSIGRNDLCHADTPTLIAAYKALRARAQAAGVGLRFATITPAGKAWPWPCEAQRIEVNNWLRTLPRTLDFEAVTITPHGMLRSAYDSGDGLHLNARGYARLARLVMS